MICFNTDASKKSDSNPLTEILKCPTKVVLLRVRTKRNLSAYLDFCVSLYPTLHSHGFTPTNIIKVKEN
jgi:hypothetical protein